MLLSKEGREVENLGRKEMQKKQVWEEHHIVTLNFPFYYIVF